MATNKKKKKAPAPARINLKTTNTYFNEFGIVAHKVLQLMGLDPTLYDKLTKREKEKLMQLKYIPFKILVMEGNTVPKAYVKYIHDQLFEFMKETYIGDPNLGLSFYNFCTYGLTFITELKFQKVRQNADELSPLGIMGKKAETYYDTEYQEHIRPLFNFLFYLTTFLSKITFRIYGFTQEWTICNQTFYVNCKIRIYSKETERKTFLFQNSERLAYRVAVSEMSTVGLSYLTVKHNDVYKGSSDTRELKVYIQSHALFRIKERLDSISPYFNNFDLRASIVRSEICKLDNNRHALTYWTLNDFITGYMPFTIIGDSLYILSFLPICSSNTPQGKRLTKLLGLNKDDSKFLGLDKLSFYKKTDFDHLPILKQALIDADMWHLTDIPSEDEYIREKPALVVRRFFEQHTPTPDKESILNEIAEEIE
ncbi:MAG: hypothetical protein Q8909_04175 [Bacteroidota bacterium]|nr:hypothetical protein [Bacteroidota bacterium]